MALLLVKAKLAGAFYVSSAPGAKAFVSVGDQVTSGTHVCVFEMMKTFSPISWGPSLWDIASVVYTIGNASFACPPDVPAARIRAVLQVNGASVSPGDLLFELEVEGLEEPAPAQKVLTTAHSSLPPMPSSGDVTVIPLLDLGEHQLVAFTHPFLNTPGSVLLEVRVMAVAKAESAPSTLQQRKELIEVRSPYVGWYNFLNPETQQPYVQLGQVVEEGQPMCRVTIAVRKKREGAILKHFPGRKVIEDQVVLAPKRGILRTRCLETWEPAGSALAFLGSGVQVLSIAESAVMYGTLLFELEPVP
jgi:biotin carboxyl carrier protein